MELVNPCPTRLAHVRQVYVCTLACIECFHIRIHERVSDTPAVSTWLLQNKLIIEPSLFPSLLPFLFFPCHLFPYLYKQIPKNHETHINKRKSTILQEVHPSKAGIPRFRFIITNSVIKDNKSSLEMAIRPS